MTNCVCLLSNWTMYSSIASISFAFSLNHTIVPGRPSRKTESPTLNRGMLRRPPFHALPHADALDLSLFDEDCLIAHSLSIQQSDGFVYLRIVVQFDITECRRHAGYEVPDNPNGPRLDTPGFDPFL